MTLQSNQDDATFLLNLHLLQYNLHGSGHQGEPVYRPLRLAISHSAEAPACSLTRKQGLRGHCTSELRKECLESEGVGHGD